MKKINSGFTLIEMMITVLIFLLLIAAILAVLTTGNTSWRMTEVRIELQQDLRRAMMWITEELRQSGISRISDVPADGTPRNTITFSIAEGVSGGNIDWEDDDIQYLLGGLNNKQLLRRQAADEKILANNIVSFQVRRQNLTPEPSNIVEIALRAEKTSLGSSTINLGLNFQVKLRN